MELLRRGYRVEVGPLDRAEVDFVAMRRDEKLYVQVAESMLDAAVYERELAPLRLIPDSFPRWFLPSTVSAWARPRTVSASPT